MADEKAIINPENNHGALHLGIDVGSTTVKLAVLNDENQIVYATCRPRRSSATRR